MDVLEIVKNWARKHKEIVAVVLGGSRAKRTALEHSDYDFGIQLRQDPTTNLINKLTQDLPLDSSSKACIFPEIERHFTLGGKGYKTTNGIDVTLGFVNITLLNSAFKEKKQYPLIDEQLEFLKAAKIIFDPKNIVQQLQTRTLPPWAAKKLVQDCTTLAEWNVDKYKKALKTRTPFTCSLLKDDALWYCTKAIAGINGISLSAYKYGYDDFKKKSIALGKRFHAPKNFFEELENCAAQQSTKLLETLLNNVKKSARSK